MRRWLAVFIISALLVAVATVVGGWPGWYALLALIPGVIIGLPLDHAINAYLLRQPLRLFYVAAGMMLGVMSGMLVVLIMSVANAPSAITITASGTINAPVPRVWKTVEAPISWAQWDALVGQLEAKSHSGPTVGSTWKGVTQIAGQSIPTTNTITAYDPPNRFAWTIALPKGTRISALSEELQLKPTGDNATRATYTLRYHAPTLREHSGLLPSPADVLGSMVQPFIRRALAAVANGTISSLRKQVSGKDAKLQR